MDDMKQPARHERGDSSHRTQPSATEPVARFRNSRGEHVELSSVTSSEAKSEFGRVLDLAIQGRAIVITKHAAARAVLLSVENFNALSRAGATSLQTLS